MRLLLTCMLLFFSINCGYRFVHNQYALPCKKIYIGPIASKGWDSGLAAKLQQELAQIFVQLGYSGAAQKNPQSCVLTGEVSRLSTVAGSSTYGEERTQSYYLRGRVQFWVQDAKGKQIWRSGNISISDMFLRNAVMGSSSLNILATESNYRRALDQASEQIVATVINRLSAKQFSSMRTVEQASPNDISDASTEMLPDIIANADLDGQSWLFQQSEN